MNTQADSTILVLSASFGAGHDSAASALVEACHAQGLAATQLDPFCLAQVSNYGMSKAFYQFCVLHAPRVWGWVYEQVDRWDWDLMSTLPPHRHIMQCLGDYITQHGTQLVICTYPLFSYMLDKLKTDGRIECEHIAVVTDAMGVSRIWLRSQASCICVTDEYTQAHIIQRYAVAEGRSIVTSFPTKAKFTPNEQLYPPQRESLRLLYAAQAPLKQVKEELTALRQHYPQAHITILGGKRYEQLVSFASPQCQLIQRSESMEQLMRQHHIYIGKAGGATTFEAYACAIPMIINYAKLEQELGNVQLLQQDQCGIHAEGAQELLAAIDKMLHNQAQQWGHMRTQMQKLPRRGGAPRIAQIAKQHLSKRNEV